MGEPEQALVLHAPQGRHIEAHGQQSPEDFLGPRALRGPQIALAAAVSAADRVFPLKSATSTPCSATELARAPSAASLMWNVGRHPTRRVMAGPLSRRPRRTGPVPFSAAKRCPTPSCLKSRESGMATPPSVSGATPLGGSRRSHEVHLAALPNCPVSAIHTAVRSVTAWAASAIGAAAGARVMAYMSSAYPVGHTAAIPAPWGSSADGIPGKGGPTLRGRRRRVATRGVSKTPANTTLGPLYYTVVQQYTT